MPVFRNRLLRPAAIARGVTLLALAILHCGCGGSDSNLPIAGKVSYDGQPLADGYITLLPTTGGSQSAGTQIEDGEFTLPAATGLPPGGYEVRIVAYRPTGRTLPDPDLPGEWIEETRQIAPARYNVQSELRIEVAPGGKDYFTFDLHSTP